MLDFSAWLDAAVTWFCTWPHWLEYLLVGWVIYAILLHQKKVHAQNFKGALVTALTLWPIGLLLMILEWLHLGAQWLGGPSSPFAALSETFRRAFSRWTTTKESR